MISQQTIEAAKRQAKLTDELNNLASRYNMPDILHGLREVCNEFSDEHVDNSGLSYLWSKRADSIWDLLQREEW